MLKKLLALALSTTILMSMGTTAFAAPDESISYLPAGIDEITEEVIQEYGIVTNVEAK